MYRVPAENMTNARIDSSAVKNVSCQPSKLPEDEVLR
jgi:hypothetical protein